MPRRPQLALMATRLLEAARARDWAALEAIDRELSQQLPLLAAQGPWGAPERATLHTLRLAHAAALQTCSDAGAALAQHIAQLRSSRDGWLAYALHDDEVPLHET